MSARRMAKMLGYMAAGNQAVADGRPVSGFVLMSDPGQLFHPAHLEPDHVVQASLLRPAPFESRKLIRATGWLRRTAARPR